MEKETLSRRGKDLNLEALNITQVFEGPLVSEKEGVSVRHDYDGNTILAFESNPEVRVNTENSTDTQRREPSRENDQVKAELAMLLKLFGEKAAPFKEKIDRYLVLHEEKREIAAELSGLDGSLVDLSEELLKELESGPPPSTDECILDVWRACARKALQQLNVLEKGAGIDTDRDELSFSSVEEDGSVEANVKNLLCIIDSVCNDYERTFGRLIEEYLSTEERRKCRAQLLEECAAAAEQEEVSLRNLASKAPAGADGFKSMIWIKYAGKCVDGLQALVNTELIVRTGKRPAPLMEPPSSKEGSESGTKRQRQDTDSDNSYDAGDGNVVSEDSEEETAQQGGDSNDDDIIIITPVKHSLTPTPKTHTSEHENVQNCNSSDTDANSDNSVVDNSVGTSSNTPRPYSFQDWGLGTLINKGTISLNAYLKPRGLKPVEKHCLEVEVLLAGIQQYPLGTDGEYKVLARVDKKTSKGGSHTFKLYEGAVVDKEGCRISKDLYFGIRAYNPYLGNPNMMVGSWCYLWDISFLSRVPPS